MNMPIERPVAADPPLPREAFERALPSTAEPLLDRAEFEAALLGAVAEFDFEQTRFCRMLSSGRCPKPMLQRYAREACRGAGLFCADLAALTELAPDPEARLILLENLLEEEGIYVSPGRGLVSRPDRGHPTLASRFVRACGGDEAGADPAEAGEPHLTARARELIDQRRWLEAVSFLLIGVELKFSAIAARLFELFARLGLDERDLAFFAVHIEADQAHGRQALDLVLDRACTAAEQQACIAAARDGARHWFAHHGASRPLARVA